MCLNFSFEAPHVLIKNKLYVLAYKTFLIKDAILYPMYMGDEQYFMSKTKWNGHKALWAENTITWHNVKIWLNTFKDETGITYHKNFKIPLGYYSNIISRQHSQLLHDRFYDLKYLQKRQFEEYSLPVIIDFDDIQLVDYHSIVSSSFYILTEEYDYEDFRIQILTTEPGGYTIYWE